MIKVRYRDSSFVFSACSGQQYERIRNETIERRVQAVVAADSFAKF